MNCLDLIDGIGRRLLRRIQAESHAELMPTEDWGWENHRYRSPRFRLAHVELFRQPQFGVVHCCVFPHVTDPAPIYGFDVIAGPSKITGVFMDLSPTSQPTEPFTDLAVGRIRDRPEWGDIFSPHWLACRPTLEEMVLIGDEAVRVLDQYLTSYLGQFGDEDKIRAGQNRYCIQQRQNEHTRKALVNLLGEQRADQFMREVLFPSA